MSNHDMKIRYKITSLLACKKKKYIFLAEHPNQAFAFGSVRKCHVRRTSVRFGGLATALILIIIIYYYYVYESTKSLVTKLQGLLKAYLH